MRAVIADDSALFRDGTSMVLAHAGIEVVGSANDRDELLPLISEHRPEVAIIDIRMPPTGTTEGIDAAVWIREKFPQTSVVLLSAHVDVRIAMRLLRTFPTNVGYLLKDRVADVADFIDDVRLVVDGGTVIDPNLVSDLVSHRLQQNQSEPLTRVETRVLELMSGGASSTRIAATMEVSQRIVEACVRGIFTKLELPPDHASSSRPRLSKREREVLLSWFMTDSKESVAQELHVSVETVNSHLKRIRAKYAQGGRPAKTKAALVARAIQDGIVRAEELG